MRLQVSKWGNSLAVRLPANYAKQSGVSNGDYLEATITTSGEMHLIPSMPATNKSALLEKLLALHRSLPKTTSVIDALRDEARY